MFPKWIRISIIASLVLTACVNQPTPPQIEQPEEVPTQTSEPVVSQQPAYPSPVDGGEQPPAYPGVGLPAQGGEYEDPAYLSPQPGDENLTRSRATIEMGDSDLLILESYPIQVVAVLNGYLPNPCHQLRVIIGSPDDRNTVQIDVYSVVDPNMICTEVIDPFSIRLPLGSFQGATYKFFVNGELLGEVDA